MSGDVAVLGLAVDSSQVTQATSALGQLTAAAKPAAAAGTALASASDAHSLSLRGQRQALAGISTDLALLGSSYGAAAAMAAQLYIENAHLIEQGGGVISVLGRLLTPTNLLIGTLAAVAAGTILITANLIATGKAFDDTGRSVGIATEELQGLAAAAAFKGIDQTDFLKAMDKFGGDVYQAQNGMGALAELMRASGQSAQTFSQYLQKASDLIKNAASDQQRLQILQQLGLPATMQWVDFLNQGSAGIQKAIDESVKFNDSAQANLIASAKSFDESWSTTWKNFTDGAKNSVLSMESWLGSLNDKIKSAINEWGLARNGLQTTANILLSGGGAKPTMTGQGDISSFYKAVGGAGTVSSPTTPDPNVMKKAISDQQTYISLLGQTASAAQVASQIQHSADLTYLNTGVSVGQKKIDELKQLAVENALGVTAIKANTDAENVSAATVGLSVGQTAQYTATQNALNQAVRDHRTLTDSDVTSIKTSASALGQAAQNADNMKFAYTGLVQGPMQAFSQALQNGSTFFDALKASGVSALNAISTKLVDMAASNLFTAAFGGGTTGGGFLSSILGSIFPAATHHTGYGPGDSSPMRSVSASAFVDAPRFHSGIGPGERAAVITNDESVLTPGQMKQLAPVGSQPNINITNNNDFTGADPGTEARLRAYVDQQSARSVQQAVQAVSQTKGTNPNFIRASR